MISSHTHHTKHTHTEKPEWLHVDAAGKVLGVLASEVAALLRGKNRKSFSTHRDHENHVVITNAAKLVVTGRKEVQKTYSRYSGYPGGLKKITFESFFAKSPQEVLRKAISGMLPKNKLRDVRLGRLHIFKDDSHTFADKFAHK